MKDILTLFDEERREWSRILNRGKEKKREWGGGWIEPAQDTQMFFWSMGEYWPYKGTQGNFSNM